MSEQPVENVEAGPQRAKGQFTMDPENLEAELAKIPLFMSDLPAEENDTLSALQSLVFDGTPEGIVFFIHEKKEKRYLTTI